MITYTHERALTPEQFIDVLKRSGLASRRPVQDVARIGTMLESSNLLVTAWVGNELVGVSRALTDFAYCTYLSDLAVDSAYQKQGIGKRLIEETRRIGGKQASLILLSAPDAMSYYPSIEMEKIENGFIIKRSD